MTATLARPELPTQRHPAPATPAAWSLVERAQAGDSDALADIYRLHEGTVFRYILFRVGVANRAVAQDLAGEVWAKALARIGSVTWQGSDIAAWLVTIARNLVADHYKSPVVRLGMTVPDVRDSAGDGPAVDDPAGDAVAAETGRILRAALDTLSPKQRRCVELRFFGGLNVAETAAAMGTNEGTVKALQWRATRALARLPELAALRGV